MGSLSIVTSYWNREWNAFVVFVSNSTVVVTMQLYIWIQGFQVLIQETSQGKKMNHKAIETMVSSTVQMLSEYVKWLVGTSHLTLIWYHTENEFYVSCSGKTYSMLKMF